MLKLDKKQVSVLVALLQQEEINLGKLVKYFNEVLGDKYPQKDRRLLASCPQEYQAEGVWVMGAAMKIRHNFILAAMRLFFDKAGRNKISLNKKLLNEVAEILSYYG